MINKPEDLRKLPESELLRVCNDLRDYIIDIVSVNGGHTNHFVLLLISYRANGANLHFEACTFVPIEMLDWSCLTLGALGWGQIQIANSNIITINPNNTRKTWMLQLCDMLDIFYPNEIAKITQRISHFQSIRNYWLNQPD